MSDPSTADRAFRAVFDAAGDFRARTAADASDPAVPVAATVLILRDAPREGAGLEVLMMERPDRGSFAGAWVFPGGKIEEADRGGGELSAARRAGARETQEEIGLEVDAEDLVPLSCWDPPPGLALRIRTWFFLATDAGGDVVLAPDEVVAARWVRPADMLARHGRGELTLYPPTWVTLAELGDHPDTGSAVDAARLRGIRRFDTVARRVGDGPIMLWEGDAAYSDQDAPGPARHRLELGALPWVYRRPDA